MNDVTLFSALAMGAVSSNDFKGLLCLHHAGLSSDFLKEVSSWSKELYSVVVNDIVYYHWFSQGHVSDPSITCLPYMGCLEL